MRLFIASGIFYPEKGGPATYLHRLLPDLVAAGHRVTALSFGDREIDGGDASLPYALTRIPRRFYPRRLWDYRQAARRLWPGHDLAYIHSLGLPLPRAARPRIAKIVGDQAWERATRKGWVPPDTDIDTFQQRRFGLAVEANKALRAREARGLDQIIVPSEHRRRMVIGWGVAPERVTVIYNAAPLEDDLPLTQAEARARLNLPDAPLLLTVARLTPLKGIDLVMQAIKPFGDVHYLVVGDGEILPDLKALAAELGIADRVHFTGWLAPDQVRIAFRAADYTMLYSGGEGLSHVLLESLSLGTPLIASDRGGNPEVAADGVNGLLVPYVDRRALAAAIEEAFAPGKRAALAAGTGIGLKRFRYDRMLAETLSVLGRFA